MTKRTMGTMRNASLLVQSSVMCRLVAPYIVTRFRIRAYEGMKGLAQSIVEMVLEKKKRTTTKQA